MRACHKQWPPASSSSSEMPSHDALAASKSTRPTATILAVAVGILGPSVKTKDYVWTYTDSHTQTRTHTRTHRYVGTHTDRQFKAAYMYVCMYLYFCIPTQPYIYTDFVYVYIHIHM